MKKISTRIIITVLVCAMFMSIVVGTTSILRSKNVIEKEAKENLHMTQQVYAGAVNEQLSIYEKTVNNIYQIVEGSIDAKRLNEQGYLKNYSKNILDPIMTGIANTTDKSGGVYVAFDVKYTGMTEGFWIGILV